MRIKWKVETYATVEINGEMTQLLFDEEYEVPEDSEYFQDALTRGWAVEVKEKE
ncbi:hypothetical protein HW132_01970 [Brasilonema sp. CT11]|nr:hypothetical protein [Brasilonema sp. CT11]